MEPQFRGKNRISAKITLKTRTPKQNSHFFCLLTKQIGLHMPNVQPRAVGCINIFISCGSRTWGRRHQH